MIIIASPRSIIPPSGTGRNLQEPDLFPATSHRFPLHSSRIPPENLRKRKQYSCTEITVPGSVQLLVNPLSRSILEN